MLKLWLKLKLSLRNAFTSQAAQQAAELGKEAFDKVTQGVEMQYLEGPAADATSKLAMAAAQMIQSLQHEDDAVIRVGALLVIKHTRRGKAVVMSQTISNDLRKILDENPTLLAQPASLLRVIKYLDFQKKCGETPIQKFDIPLGTMGPAKQPKHLSQ
jgi:hypothetical protein